MQDKNFSPNLYKVFPNITLQEDNGFYFDKLVRLQVLTLWFYL